MSIRKFNDLAHKGSPETLAKVRLELQEGMALHELRQARGFTQAQLAQVLDTKQSGISRIEHQTDLYLSTLDSYVKALGGQLELRATFDGVEIPIKSLEDLEPVEA